MSRRSRILIALALAALALQGCAGLLEFRQPAESLRRKQKEDPPGTLLTRPALVAPC
jgi:hypothetical protein